MKHRMLVTVFVSIFSLLLPSVSMATTEISPDTIKDWMAKETMQDESYIPPKDRARVNTFLNRALVFRIHTSKEGLDAAIQKIGASADTFSQITAPPPHNKFPEIWPYIFAGSIVFAGNVNSDTPVSAYYNVYLDAITLILWRASGNSFVPDNVRVMSGATFLNDKSDPTPLPVWITTPGTVMGMMKHYRRVSEHFTRLFPFNSAKRPTLDFQYDTILQREIVESRSLRSYLLLRTLLHEKDQSGLYKLVTQFDVGLVAGDVEAIASFLPTDNLMSPEHIVEIPYQVRNDLKPIFVVVGAEHTLLFKQAMQSPRFITVTELNSQGQPRMESFGFLDLETKP